MGEHQPAGGHRSPVSRTSFSTRDPDQAHSFLETVYADHVVRMSGSRDGFRFRHTMAGAAGFAVARVRHTSRVYIAAEPLKDVLSITTFHRGPGEITHGRDTVRPGRNEPVLTPIGPMRTWWDDLDNTTVVLDPQAVADHAVAVSGIDRDRFAFHGMRPVSPGLARFWLTTVAHVRDHVLAEPAHAGPLVLTGTFRWLANALLTVFPNTTHPALSDTAARPATVSASRLRRAVDYLEAHAGDPIGPADLVDAAGVRFGDLNHTLRCRRGRSVGQQVWRVRLDGAHRDLRAADHTHGITVATIAARWGFPHGGRFARVYQAAYGCRPEQTLHDRAPRQQRRPRRP